MEIKFYASNIIALALRTFSFHFRAFHSRELNFSHLLLHKTAFAITCVCVFADFNVFLSPAYSHTHTLCTHLILSVLREYAAPMRRSTFASETLARDPSVMFESALAV